MPRVSVIIPTYNYAQFVEQAILSVLAQTYKNFEIIVVDDGSTDTTAQRLQPYTDQGEITYLYQPNKGLPGARNTGIRHSQGEFIAFLDADDIWTPDKLQLQVELFDRQPELGFIFGNSRKFLGSLASRRTSFEDISPSHGDVTAELLQRSFLPMPTVIVRRSALEAVGLFDETLDSCEDLDMWLRLSLRFKAGYVDQVVAWYRLHSLSMSSNFEKIATRRLRVIKKFTQQLEAEGKWNDSKQLIQRVLGVAYDNAGRYALAACHRSAGLDYLREADRLLGRTMFRIGISWASAIPGLLPALLRWKTQRLSKQNFRPLAANEFPTFS